MPKKDSMVSRTLRDMRKRVRAGDGTWDDERFTEIITGTDQIISDHTERDEIWDQLEDMYLVRSDKVPDSQDDYTTISLKPHLAVGQLQDILCTTPAQATVPEIGESEDAKKLAERVRTVLNAFMWRVEESGDEILPQLVSQAAIFSRVTTKTLDRRRLWIYRGYSDAEIMEFLEDGELPFLLTPVHPRGIYVRRLEDKIDWVVQVTKMRYADIHRFFGEKASFLDAERDETEVEIYEFWDDKEQCIWVNGVGRPIIGPIEHGTVNPFSVRDVRSSRYLGIADREGHSMLRPLLDGSTWHRENLILTLMANNAYHLINQTFVTYTKNGQPVVGDVSKPGGQIAMAIGESVGPLRTGDIPEVVKVFQSYLEGESDLALVPRVMSGNAPGGVTAGYAINILSQSARSKIASIQRAVERCYADSLQKVLRILRDGPDDSIPIWGKAQRLVLNRKDLEKRHQIIVNLAARLPQDKMSDTQVALAMKQTGVVSDEYIAEQILEVPPEREEERLYMENFQKIVAPLHYLETARKLKVIRNDEEEDIVRAKLGLPPRQPQTPALGRGGPQANGREMVDVGLPPPEALGDGGQEMGSLLPQGGLMPGAMPGEQANPMGDIGGLMSSVFPAAETGLAPTGQDPFAALAGGMGAPGGVRPDAMGPFGI